MTLTLNIPAELESRLREQAGRAGLDPAEYARLLIERSLPETGASQGLLDSFSRWEAEDATDDPAELTRRRREVEDFMRGMNRSRVESEGPAARKPYPDVP